MTMRVEFNPQKVDTLLYQLAGYSFIRKFLKVTDIVLDVGCGEGHTTKFLAEKCYNIIGLDTDDDLMANNQLKYHNILNLSFFNIDIMKYDMVTPDKRNKPKTILYDVIVCRDLIEHLSQKHGELLIRKLLTLLKSESSILFLGTVRVGVVLSRPEKQGHVYEYSYSQLKDLLERYFDRVVFFSQTDEIVTLVEPKEMCWRWIVMCWGKRE